MIRDSLKSLAALAAIFAITAGSAATASAAKPKPPKVKTKVGTVIGVTVGGVNEFLGIPYAAPPVGALRWQPPQALPKFKKPFAATAFGSECPQAGGGSEDCLFLNVFEPTPAKPKPKGPGLPVMVWIHGGGLVSESSASYDPTPLVQQGVIVVTINYRLGYLGFFAHPAIDAEGHLNGNYGLMDQQFALKWVQANIKPFGGNPAQVTIFGQSAGGQSVYAQLASPLAAGLFEGAIAQSGAYANFRDYFPYYLSLAVAETTGSGAVPSGNAVAQNVGCGAMATAACLRGVAAAAMVAGEPGTIYPFIDGTLLTQTFGDAFSSGNFNRVPVIAGTNHDEDRFFVALSYDLSGNPITTPVQYQTAVTALWTSLLQKFVLALYPFASFTAGGEALASSGTDGIYSCPARTADQSLSKFVTTFAYEFNDENAPPAQSAISGLTFALGAYHNAELEYLFNGNDFSGLASGSLSSDQMLLSASMISYWTQFAKTGDPNSASEPTWPAYTTANDEFMSLAAPTPAVETGFDTDHQCSKFWDTF